MNHEFYMQRALKLAAKGAGWVNPNPKVGAVIVANGEVIGEGYHTRYGNLHAEREALADCKHRGNDPAGATIYVTLEPCCHTGKQPPCVEALIEAGIGQVVMGAPDPNPLVAGKGIAQLREAGIEVVEGVMVEKCRKINRAWLHYIQTKHPFVTLKYAMTLDGKIATASGDSKWVTGVAARQRVHEDRAKTAAILVGVNTVLADNPQLTARPAGMHNPHQPTRFVIDPSLRIPLDTLLVQRSREVPTIIVASQNADATRKEALEGAGCSVWGFPTEENGTIPIPLLLEHIGQEGYDSVIVEGGAKTAGAFLDADCVDFVQAYIAPKIIGGAGCPSPVAGNGAHLMSEAIMLDDVHMEHLGGDFLVSGTVCKGNAREEGR